MHGVPFVCQAEGSELATLLAYGADPNTVDPKLNVPLLAKFVTVCDILSDIESMVALLRAGADPDWKNDEGRDIIDLMEEFDDCGGNEHVKLALLAMFGMKNIRKTSVGDLGEGYALLGKK